MKLQIAIYPSFYCNLQCDCCMHNCSPNNKDTIDIRFIEYFLKFLEWCLKNNYDISCICISGGEPLLYSDIYKLIENINKVMKNNYNGKKVYFSMVSNGTVKIDNAYIDSLGDLEYPLSSVRISTSCFLDKQLNTLGIKQNFTQYNKLAQECSFRRITMINDKGKAKQLIESNPEIYYNSYFYCYNDSNDIVGINFMPKFISFCSEDSGGLDPDKTMQYEDLIKNSVIEYSFIELIKKAKDYKDIQNSGGCKNKCKHYVIKNGK